LVESICCIDEKGRKSKELTFASERLAGLTKNKHILLRLVKYLEEEIKARLINLKTLK
jgi:hypothetical protein